MSWKRIPLRHATVVLSRGTAPDYCEDGPVRMISQAANQDAGIDWNRTRFHAYDGDPRKLKGFLQSGDSLVNSTGTGTLGRVGWFSSSPDSRPCVADGHVTLVRFDPEHVHDRFGHYFLNSDFFQNLMFETLVFGSTNQIELSRERMLGVPIFVPGLADQRATANFLDIETTRIDALIVKKLVLLQALGERFRRLVDEATNIGVLGALDPVAKLPHEWRFPMLRRCFSSIQYGIGEATSDTGTYPVLGMGNIDDHGAVTGPPGGFVDDVDSSLLLQPGDLLFNRTNSLAKVGKVGLVQDVHASMTFASYLVRLRVSGLADSNYLNYALNTVDFLRLARSVALPSIGQANLNPARYTELRVPLPPLHRQKSIARELDRERSHLNSLRSRTERQIYLLRERRQALITAAVTGEMEVPGVSR